LMDSDTVGTVVVYLFLPTGILQATGARPSSTHLWYFGEVCYLVLADTAGTSQ
jgi:hypothetical protein